jgi:hypothetical protein
MFDGEYDVVPGAAVNDWDPGLKRHTFTQAAVVWRSFDSVRMKVSPAGEVIAFSDQNRFDNATFRLMTSEEILAVCRTAALVGPAAQVTAIEQGRQGTLSAVIIEPIPRAPRRLRVSINPTTRQLAAFEAESSR